MKPVPDEHGACHGCARSFVEVVTDHATQALYGGDGYCHGCEKWRKRNGRPPESRYATGFPPGTYRCPNSMEATLRRYEEWRAEREARLLARFPQPR